MVALLFISMIVGALLIFLAVSIWRKGGYMHDNGARLLYSVVHDEISNPIQIALSTLANVDKRVEETQSPLREDIISVQNSIKNISSVTKNLKALALLETQGVSEVKQRVDLIGIAQRVIVDMGEDAERQGVVLMFEGGDCSASVFGNETDLTRMVSNLIDNGVKYARESNEQSVVITSVEASKKRVTLTVEDNGKGISKEKQKILGVKPALRDAHTVGSRGSGLGWVFIKTVVSRHRAALRIDSVEGRGSKIRIQFPNADVSS